MVFPLFGGFCRHNRGLPDRSPTRRAEEEVVLREIKEVTEVWLRAADKLAGHFSLR